jgi:NAD(P)H dehydrogenase (quinone)
MEENLPRPKILVTGATGKTGTPTVLKLLHLGFPVRALVHRNDVRSEHLRSAGAEIVVGSLENIRDLETAMSGVARAYFCPPLEPGTVRRAALFAVAAHEAKLEAVVHLSQWLADPIHPAAHAREKWLSNYLMERLPGVATVKVQPGWFADNYFAVLGQVAQFGILGLPLGNGQNAPPSNEDIAAVIAVCLADPDRHAGKSYRPTGPKLMAPADIAAVMGQALTWISQTFERIGGANQRKLLCRNDIS